GALLFVHAASAQSFSPLTDFQALSLAQLDSLQVKITYVGSQKKITPTVAFRTAARPLDLSVFVPYERAKFGYGGDAIAIEGFSVSGAEMRAIIDSVAALTDVAAGSAVASGRVSFSLSFAERGKVKVFESIVDTSAGIPLFQKLLSAVATNAA